MKSIDQDMNDDDLNQDLPPGLVGLQNLGNTCYMNGALQALSNCQQLTRYVLSNPTIFKNKSLSHSYSELLKQIWDKRDSQYAVPTSIIRNIKCIYPAFRGFTQQDAQEFLRCFLEQLHDELKEPHPDSLSNPKSGERSGEGSTHPETNEEHISGHNDHQINERDHANSINVTCNNTSNKSAISNTDAKSHTNENEHRSIISDTFEFKIISSVVCSSCNNISTTIESFKDLSIPIPSRDHPYYDIAKTSQGRFKIGDNDEKTSLSLGYSDNLSKRCEYDRRQSDSSSHSAQYDRLRGLRSSHDLQAYESYPIFIAHWFWSWLGYVKNWFWGPNVTLNDCLSIFFGTDPLEGDNEYSCDICTKKNRGVKYLKILQLPDVLCIHFKRYESVSSSKITTHVSFPLKDLDLAPFMCEDAQPQCTTYKLIACICHHGSALLTGHYTTYALNCYDDQWYEFDDQYVTNVDRSQVEDSEAYILFYQKDDCLEEKTSK